MTEPRQKDDNPRWVDVELVDGPLAGHTTSMLTHPDGVTPRAFTIVIPPVGVCARIERRLDLRYKFEGLRLECVPGRVENIIYLYEEVV